MFPLNYSVFRTMTYCFVVKLGFIETSIQAFLRQQILVSTALDDLALVEYIDVVGTLNRRQTMSDYY